VAAFSSEAFSTDAFSESAYDFGDVVVSSIDTHDGFDEKKHSEPRKRKERLHNQLEEAFYEAFGGRPVLPVMARNDEPLQEFVFPAYRENPVFDEDDEEAAALLLTT
jgi:hypothetical protein